MGKEEALELAIKQALSHCGYSFLKTGKALKKTKCKVCGAWDYPEGTNNNDPATPDLLVFRDGWTAGMMLGLEVKVPKDWNWSCNEQRLLAERERIVVVHTVRGALTAVQIFEIDNGYESQTRIVQWLKANEGANI